MTAEEIAQKLREAKAALEVAEAALTDVVAWNRDPERPDWWRQQQKNHEIGSSHMQLQCVENAKTGVCQALSDLEQWLAEGKVQP